MTEYYDLLNRQLRSYIYDKKWPSLTSIQKASIKHIYSTTNNLILEAPTARGKTEAAFLPCISKVDDFKAGIRIIYISPLIALINDQFKRINEMCDDLEIKITSWHSESNTQAKKKILENPEGILLITPESLEAFLCLRSDRAYKFFKNVDYIIIDELHSFLSGNRSIALRSVLTRLLRYTDNNPRMIGLSATIGMRNYDIAKSYFINQRSTNILVDKYKNTLENVIFYEQAEHINEKILEKILEVSKKGSVLIFPNTRKLVEEISVSIKKIIKNKNLDIKVFAHHSFVSKQKRLKIEEFAKSIGQGNFIICASSTLELGIDIGALDYVIMYNSCFTTLSFAQRLGRSGRKSHINKLVQILTNPWDLLQSLAITDLYENGEFSKLEVVNKPYDVFSHQILAYLLENNGINKVDFANLRRKLPVFSNITYEESLKILKHLIENKYIEDIGNEYIVGLNVEKLLSMGYFYNQFISKDSYKVTEGKNSIGSLNKSTDVKVGENIYLAGSIWEITNINDRKKEILVKKAPEGKSPRFSSNEGIDISDDIREKMLDILNNKDKYIKDEKIRAVLEDINLTIKNNKYYFLNDDDTEKLVTFRSTKVNRTLALIFNYLSKSNKFNISETEGAVYGKDLYKILSLAINNKLNEEKFISYLEKNPLLVQAYLSTNKYMNLIPFDLKVKYLINNKIDLDKAYEYLMTNYKNKSEEICK